MKNLFLALTLAFALTLTGCNKPKDLFLQGPGPETLAVEEEYITEAFASVDGKQAWADCKKTQFDAVVTFYKDDGSRYLTEHTYEIYPWSGAIRITAAEPDHTYRWQVVDGNLMRLSGPADSAMPIDVNSTVFAELVRDITTAPAVLATRAKSFTKPRLPTRIRGLWYHPIENQPEKIIQKHNRRDNIRQKPPRKKIFYQNRETGRIEIVEYPDTPGGRSLAARGFDYQELFGDGPLLPSRIEIYVTGEPVYFKNLLVKIDVLTGP